MALCQEPLIEEEVKEKEEPGAKLAAALLEAVVGFVVTFGDEEVFPWCVAGKVGTKEMGHPSLFGLQGGWEVFSFGRSFSMDITKHINFGQIVGSRLVQASFLISAAPSSGGQSGRGLLRE